MLVFDFEHTGILYDNPMPWPRNGKVGELLLVGYACGSTHGVTRLDIGPLPPTMITLLNDPKAYIVAFNIHHELAWLYHTYGIWPAGKLFDPMIGFHLLDETYPDKSLEGILKKIFKIEPYKASFWRNFNVSNMDWGALSNYSRLDITHTTRLAKWVANVLQQQGLTRLFDHEMANRATATYGTIRGVRYNLQKAAEQAAALAAEALEVEKWLRDTAGSPTLNLASPQQVLPILQLFDPNVRATDATTLRRLLWTQPENTFASNMLRLRRIYSQLRYLSNYEKTVYDDGLMHFESHPMSKTGRLRANSPNLQNVMR